MKEVEFKEVPRFCVLVGANGSGKFTFFSVLGFLKDALSSNVQVTLTKLGRSRGFSEIRSRGQDGNIEIELKFRESSSSPLITYLLSIEEHNGRAVIKREVLKSRRGSKGKPWHFLDFEGRNRSCSFRAFTSAMIELVDEQV